MGKESTARGRESRVAWEALEAFARDGVQRLLQRVLEEEVDQLLGRRRTSDVTSSRPRRAIATASASRAG
jgi:hypothetical protein